MECDKVSYPSHSEAIAAIKGMANDGNKYKMKTYKCHDCGLFHLATEGKRKFIPKLRTGPSETKFPMSQAGPFPKQRRIEKSFDNLNNKLISKELATHLKRLIEGKNNMLKKLS